MLLKDVKLLVLSLADSYVGPCLNRVQLPQVAPLRFHSLFWQHFITGLFCSLIWLHPQAKRDHLSRDSEPVAAADVRVDLEAHVVRHIILAHIHQRIQSILHPENFS